MTINEAIDFKEKLYGLREAIDMAIEALEKQIAYSTVDEEEATQSTEALKMQEQKSSGKKVTRCADCFFWHELERCGYCNKHKIYVGQDDGCTMGEVDQ